MDESKLLHESKTCDTQSPPAKVPTPGIVEPDDSEAPGKKAKTEETSPPPPPTELTRSQNGKLDVEEDSAIIKVDDATLKELEDRYSSYFQYAAAEPYFFNVPYWYESWRTSAFRPWPSLAKDGKTQPILRDSVPQSVPAYLSRGPPILLHPDRVVPLSESERFERSFQPNVALAPASHHRPKLECSETQVKCEPDSREDSKVINGAGAGATYNPEIELSTDTDDSCSEAAGEPRKEHRKDRESRGGQRVVEQVAEVLDALSDAKEATRARVVGLVKQLASRLDLEEANVRQLASRLDREESVARQLEEENAELRRLVREQAETIAIQERKVAQLALKCVRPETPLKADKVILSAEGSQSSNLSQPAPTQTSCSPVSVITTSPGLVIKTEPTE